MTRFSGIAPAVSSRLLNEQFGQTAQNIDFEAGRVTPITEETTVGGVLASTSKGSIFYHDSVSPRWLQWDEDYVKAVEGPIPGDNEDRLYWTGEGTYPKMSHHDAILPSGGGAAPAVSYRLGIPAPAALGIAEPAGDVDEDVEPIDVAYVMTWVSNFGEEGPPSSVTVTKTFTPTTQSITITRPSLPSGNYAVSATQGDFPYVALWRLYRSAVGATQASFLLAKEDSITATTFVDSLEPAQLLEVLPSTTWIGPPDDVTATYPDGPMQGLIPVANGVFAGFTGKRLCLSEA
ncbi:uncharacterized protein METZ01_LOCUS150855, partial [marine metagenome]